MPGRRADLRLGVLRHGVPAHVHGPLVDIAPPRRYPRSEWDRTGGRVRFLVFYDCAPLAVGVALSAPATAAGQGTRCGDVARGVSGCRVSARLMLLGNSSLARAATFADWYRLSASFFVL